MKKLKLLLTTRELRHFLLLLGLLVVKAILQVIGVASILPFMSLAAKPDLVHTNEWLNKIYLLGGFENEHSMLVALGVMVLVYIALSNAFVAFSGWVLSKYTMGIAHRMGVRMVRSYIAEPYEFFLTRTSIDLLKRVIQEVGVFVQQVLAPLLDVISKGLVSLVIFVMLFIVDAKLASIVMVVLGGAYMFIYLAKRRALRSLGEERLAMNQIRFKSMSDLMTGIKEIQLYDARPYFFTRFFESSKRIARIFPQIHLVTVSPRYLIETLAFGGILLVTLYLLKYSGSIVNAIPVLSLYVVSGYRLIPSLQSTFQSWTTIKHAWPVVDEIMLDYNRPAVQDKLTRMDPENRLPYQKNISFKDVSFTYAGEEAPALKSINCDIKRGDKVAFVGRTGSGKTTLVDVLTGLLAPTSGTISIDGSELTEANRGRWKQQLGYVTQELFLFDDSITRNVAFGVPDDEIDHKRVIEAAKMAQAHDFIMESLPKGYDTTVGERGVRLSGGQRVRLGLARALYRKPSVVILDEATSALDGITERVIIDELAQSPYDLTLIIIAHRMSSVKSCDSIFVLENGILSDAGSYDDLLKTSDVFSEMQELTS
jgi:ABC-type bacteriocin/lantibiotic exporter with double-glycine peptidase domain